MEGRKAWIIGNGIAGRAAACYLVRDGGMRGGTSPSCSISERHFCKPVPGFSGFPYLLLKTGTAC
ncbi:oleate hydratase [Granulibacter bethesdensis]|uniref:oleate hydratase n=1 Tax=Granulibacter bethesdensis TaxID=364410 RepID=UPI000932E363